MATGKHAFAMDAGVVECVAHHHLTFQLAAAVTQTVGGLRAHRRLREHLLTATEAGKRAILYTGVFVEQEALLGRVVIPGRTFQSGEAVHDQGRALILRADTGAQHFRRKTPAALVQRAYLERIDDVGLERYAQRRALNHLPVVESIAPTARVHHVTRRSCTRLQRVAHGAPAQHGLLAALVQTDGEVGHRERGHNKRLVVHRADISQHALVNRAAEVKLEIGVVAQTHVGEVLVRKHLEDDARNVGGARFAIVAVPQGAHLEIIFLHVAVNALIQQAGQVAAGMPVHAAG